MAQRRWGAARTSKAGRDAARPAQGKSCFLRPRKRWGKLPTTRGHAKYRVGFRLPPPTTPTGKRIGTGCGSRRTAYGVLDRQSGKPSDPLLKFPHPLPDGQKLPCRLYSRYWPAMGVSQLWRRYHGLAEANRSNAAAIWERYSAFSTLVRQDLGRASVPLNAPLIAPAMPPTESASASMFTAVSTVRR